MDKRLEKFGITDNLGAWTNENGQELIEKSILEAETINYITVEPGVKYKKKIKFLDTDALLQSAAACGTPTSSGTTTLSSKELSVKPYMIFEELCPQDIEDTSLSLSMKPGAAEELPFEAQFVNLKAKLAKKKIENKFWINVSGSTEFEGIINQCDKDSDVVDVTANFTTTGLTDSQFIALFVKMIDAIPEDITSSEDLTMFMGKDLFTKLSRAFLNSSNILLQKFNFNGVDTFVFPGAENVKVLPVNGLNKSNNTNQRVVLTPASNLIFVTDMVSEEDYSKMWWSDDDQKLKYIAKFKMGAAYKFGEYIVINQLS